MSMILPVAPAAVKSADLLPPSLLYPGAVRAAFAPFASPLPLAPTPAEHDLADRLAWEADGGDPDAYEVGWAGPSSGDDAAYAAMLADRHGADHDGQFDPFAVELWTVSAADYRWQLASEQYALDAAEDERLADLEAANREARGWWHHGCRAD